MQISDGKDSQPLSGLIAGDEVCVKARLPRHLQIMPGRLMALSVEELQGAAARQTRPSWPQMTHRKGKRQLKLA
jgi:hypothetical protein